MRDYVYLFIIFFGIVCLGGFSCYLKKETINHIVKESKPDTIYIENKDSINILNNIIIDKENMIDSLNSELFVYKYKINRVKEYVRISNNGNNIKYLRGWINRVLNE